MKKETVKSSSKKPIFTCENCFYSTDFDEDYSMCQYPLPAWVDESNHNSLIFKGTIVADHCRCYKKKIEEEPTL